MKTKTTKALAPMVGRRIKLTLPNYDTEGELLRKGYEGKTRRDIIKACLGHVAARSHFLLKYLDQEAEIVNVRNDDGFIYTLLFSDGMLHDGYAHEFIVLPVAPEKPISWEYCDLVMVFKTENTIRSLRELGEAGWEMVAVSGDTAYFKRKITI